MDYTRYRKHPRVYRKDQEEERILDLSVTSAVGVLAFAFVTGAAAGYLIKKVLSD